MAHGLLGIIVHGVFGLAQEGFFGNVTIPFDMVIYNRTALPCWHAAYEYNNTHGLGANQARWILGVLLACILEFLFGLDLFPCLLALL